MLILSFKARDMRSTLKINAGLGGIRLGIAVYCNIISRFSIFYCIFYPEDLISLIKNMEGYHGYE